MTAEQLIRHVEQAGGSLELRGNRIHYRLPKDVVSILTELKAHRDEVLTVLRHRSPAAIPAGVILLAPRYDGAGKPLAAIPLCWCCQTPYQLERLQEWKGNTYAWLKPGCGCLDVPQALACCGLCIDHCQCPKPSTKPENTILDGNQGAEEPK